MTTLVDSDQFERDGFVVVPNALDVQEVARLREYFVQLFARPPEYGGDHKQARLDIFSRYPETRTILVNEKVVAALRALLGDDYVVVPEAAVHDSRYGFWHKDTAEVERADHFFHWEPDFRMVQCGIYLQDNDEHGGGLDILPGSHKNRENTPPVPIPTLWQRIGMKLGLKSLAPKPAKQADAYSIPNKAGDMVIFDLRANHMATQPRSGSVEDVPASKRKLAVFFICSANNEHAWSYRTYIAGRDDYDYLNGGEHEYPAEMRELAEQHRLTLI